jgi:hypothetical protein
MWERASERASTIRQEPLEAASKRAHVGGFLLARRFWRWQPQRLPMIGHLRTAAPERPDSRQPPTPMQPPTPAPRQATHTRDRMRLAGAGERPQR